MTVLVHQGRICEHRDDQPDVRRIKAAIAVMQRVVNKHRKFDMANWQDFRSDYPVATEHQLHVCGTSACFGGWLAVSPEFQTDGGMTHPQNGAPYFIIEDKFVMGPKAIAIWLNIPEVDAIQLTCAGVLPSHHSPYYGKAVWDIKAEHVVEKLKAML